MEVYKAARLWTTPVHVEGKGHEEVSPVFKSLDFFSA
jgi:hypothetical protein